MKKPYASPQIIRVQLNPEQAVISACSIRATALPNILSRDECMKPGGSYPNGCRRGKNNEDDGASS